MQWKLVATMQSVSTQKRNNWGMQMTILGCKRDAKRTQEREREREREREKERRCQEGNERQSAHSGALRLKLRGKPNLLLEGGDCLEIH